MPKKSAKESSEKPKKEEEKTENQKLSAEEYEKKVIELAKSGLTSEKIGEALRKERIHPGEHGRKISKILLEKGMYSQSDLKNVEAKLNKLQKHHESNKQDKKSLKDLERTQAKLRKINLYFHKR